MLQALKSKRPQTVADLTAAVEKAEADLKAAEDALADHVSKIGAASLSGDSVEELNTTKRHLEDDVAAWRATRDEAKRQLRARRQVEDEAEGKRLRKKQRDDCAKLDELFRQAAELIGEIVDGDLRLASINTGVSRPLSRAMNQYQEANRLETHAGHEAEQRRADLNRFTHDRKAIVGRDYASSPVAELLALVATMKDAE